MNQGKQELRRDLVKIRRDIPHSIKHGADQTIAQVLFVRPEVQLAQMICIYVSLPEEVDTHGLIHRLLDTGKTVIVPRVVDNHLKLCQIQSFADLVPGNFDILEPNDQCQLVDRSTVDLFIVPGVAFDRLGHRLGWGKGHYDRLLQDVKVPKIGLAYGCQVVSRLPYSSYDIPMSVIISEKETIVYEK